MSDSSIVRVSPAARRDLDERVAWLRGEAGPDTALRLADAVFGEFTKLAALPGIGSPVPTQRPELAGLHKWRVSGFPKFSCST